MWVNAIIRSAVAAVVVSSLPCAAQIFGELRPAAEARSFRPSGLLADPAIARWLMTLPSDAAAEPAAPETSFEARLLLPDPIGGEVYRFVTADTDANAALGSNIFAADPIGGEAYRFDPPAQPSRAAVAENAAQEGARPALQGRSVAKHAVRRRLHQARAETATGALRFRPRLGSCRCGLVTGRSVAKRARPWQPTSEGHADLPAPRGPAGSLMIMPF